ncbi:uncharacterized protein LOC120109982 [Phoenix dactylifera]|uniref:Uncharacterized protein LOC120109982 n=1 Tax=Phoenix dactylifera TaxID=42345 RepID=A0A8B9A7K7_PHODC|nr:uncharacterized protein LOC120109982 [Phoenix dactylifera]
MRMALNAKNKLGFIDGSLSKPTSNTAEIQVWERCMDMVLSWLLNSIDKSLINTIIYCNSPREVWLDLEERFSHSNNPRVFKLKRDIYTLNQGNLSLMAYYNTIKGYWDELAALQTNPICSCGGLKELHSVQETEKVFQFLMGLNESYTSICSQILAMEPLPTVAKISVHANLILKVEEEDDHNVTIVEKLVIGRIHVTKS